MQTDRSAAGIFRGGALLIAVGLITMADPLFRALHWELSWPLLLIGLSTILFIGVLLGKKHAAWLAIPACILGGTGLGMSFYSLTHHWKMLFYFWTLLLGFTGVGIYIMGWKAGSVKQKNLGWGLMRAGFFLFVILGSFFEMLFSRFSATAFPLLLVTTGLCVVLSRFSRFAFSKVVPLNSVSPANPRG